MSAAYVEFITASDDLLRTARAWHSKESTEARSSEFGAETLSIVGRIDQATAAVTLAGPAAAAHAASEVKGQVWAVFYWFTTRDRPYESFGALMQTYVRGSVAFTEIAQASFTPMSSGSMT